MTMRDLKIGTKAGLTVLSNRWYALILLNLTDAASDFMQLRNAVRGISTFDLLIKVNELVDLKLVTSTADYHYQLSSTGQHFQQTLLDLTTWGDQRLARTLQINHHS